MVNVSDYDRDAPMLVGKFSKCGYDWWWHSFTAYNEETGEARPFHVEFFICNPALGGDEPVLGQVSKEAVPSYLMTKVGAWGEGSKQLHNFYGWNKVDLDFKKIPYEVTAGDCYCSETYTKGVIEVTDAENHPEWMCDNGTVSWDLKINKKIAWNVGYGAGSFFRKLKAFQMFWHAEGVKTEYSGHITLDGVKYVVRPEDCYGYADKNWGSDFTSPWLWLSSCNLTSLKTGKKLENSVFDIGGGSPKVFGIRLYGKLLGEFYYEGTSYEFNFSKFWTGSKTKFEFHETDTQGVWYVEQTTRKAKLVTDITCEKKDMMLINYEAPNGKKLHNRLWNGGNGQGVLKLYVKNKGQWDLLDEVEAKNVGCEYGEFDKE